LILTLSISIISLIKDRTLIKNEYIIVTEEVKKTVKYDTIHIDRATTYNAVVSQCDGDPLSTADGTKIDLQKLKNQEVRYVALSRDLIWDEKRQKLFPQADDNWHGFFEFGDTITVYSAEHPNLNGEWIVHDCMNARYMNSMDFLFDPINNKPKLGIGTDIKLLLEHE
jgi:hypothetical protein